MTDTQPVFAPSEPMPERKRGRPTKTSLIATPRSSPSSSEIFFTLRRLQQRRLTAIGALKVLEAKSDSLVRTVIGYTASLPPADRKRLVAEARKIRLALEKDGPLSPEHMPYEFLRGDIMALRAAANPVAQMRKIVEKDMEAIATSLPVWKDWAVGVKGFGPRGLAIICAEAWSPGAVNIGEYRTVSGLWKRLGFAVIDGERQQKKTNAALAVQHGFAPRRHAEVFSAITDPLAKHQWNAAKEDRDAAPAGPYGVVYDREKNKALLRVVATEALPYSDRDKWTPLRAERHARRLMTKALLLDLWRVWRGMPPRYELTSAT